MSCRQAPRAAAAKAMSAIFELVRNFRHLSGLETLEKLARAVVVEHGVAGLYTQEEAIAGCERETRHVERRVIRHRQPAEREQAEHGGDRREQNRHLKRDDDVGRPAMQRASRDIDREVYDGDKILQQVPERAAQNA